LTKRKSRGMLHASDAFAARFVQVLHVAIIVTLGFAGNCEAATARHLFDIDGGGSTRLSLPTDVAVSQGRVCVVDGTNDRVVIFNEDGDYLFEIGGKGSAQGQFLHPVGIATDDDGRVYVADTGNHRVQVFNLYGKFLTAFPIISNGELVRPIDLAVDQPRGIIYVTGNNNHSVMAYGANGRLIRQWGGNGAEQGEFRYPATIALLPDQRVAVVDVLNTRVQVFHGTGEFSIEIGAWGVLPGQLFRPKGVAIDRKGRFFVSDSYMNVIQIYSDIGRFLSVMEIRDPGYHLQTPTGMTISGDRLYVAELLANKISVFALDN